ncbi:MAG: hypothetical protein HYZ35_04515, partial [Chloroflexi bacterium]|nr:hypothetical protein [Chloroflexota bacterium]
VPGDVAVVLHAWDDNGETVMRDGVADSSGAFRFGDVPLQDGWVFAAMVLYKDVTFFSESGTVAPETTEIALSLNIYETAADATPVVVSQLHTLLEFAQGEVLVTEVYVLSNPTDRALVGGVALPDGQMATLQFALPSNANKVSFDDSSGASFFITPDGFADADPVLPGENTTKAIVSYSLPYASGASFSHGLNYPVEAVNILVRSDIGVALTGFGESKPMDAGTGDAFDLYTAGPLAAGEPLAITLKGEPAYYVSSGRSGTMSESSTLAPNTPANRWGIPAAAAIVGAAMIGFGVWWWRRSGESEEESDTGEPETEWSTVVRAIAELDDAHQRGDINEEAYDSQRAGLRVRAKAILQAKEENK